MALIHCDFHSDSLDMSTSMNVILPEKGDLHNAKVIYLFHGLQDNSSGWIRLTNVEFFVRTQNLVVVTPEVQRSFYTDMDMGIDYFQYVSEELPRICRNMFNLSDKRENNYVMGLSMGGYGALKCALTNPQNYAGVAAFSSVIDIQDRVDKSEGRIRREFAAIFGTDLKVPASSDLFALVKKANPQTFPKILTFCGEQDSLYEENVAFSAMLKERGFDTEFTHWEGEHSWAFWNRAIQCTIETFFPEQV